MIINVAFAIPPTSVKFTHWHDGFTEAMGLLADRYEVRWLNVHPLAPQMKKARRQLFDCDFLLVKSNFGWIPDMAYIRGGGETERPPPNRTHDLRFQPSPTGGHRTL